MVRSALSRRAIFAPLALLGLLAVSTGSLALYQITASRQSREWIVHSYRVIEAVHTMFSRVKDVESGTRGFMVNGNTSPLDDYDDGLAAFPAAADQLQALVRDNPAQAQRVRQLRQELELRISLARERVELGRAGKLEKARTTNSGTGKAAMDQARDIMARVIASEQQLLADRTKRSDSIETTGVLLALIAGALAIIGLVYLFITMVRVNRGLGNEIVAREAAEKARVAADQLSSAVFKNAGDYLFVVAADEGGDFSLVDGNRAFAEATGFPIERLRGRKVSELQPGPLGDLLTTRYAAVVASGKPTQTRTEMSPPGGTRVWESTMVPIAGASGRIDRIVEVARDVTERERMEAQRISAQKMEAVSHLTGGVAHDFNNLLQVIHGNLELLEPLLRHSDAGSQRLKNALRGAERAASLTRQLLAFARRQPLEPRVVSLGRLVGEMGEMLARTLGEGIAVETVVAGGLWNTLVDPAQVESAILNLAINARDAMNSEGKLTIELANATIDEAYTDRVGVEAEPGQYVLLAISDTGHGMSPEVMARVFEPFFTTKAADKGTGLGLSMVYGFVKQSRGHIQIYSEQGEGTTVKLYLPRSRKAEDVQAAAPIVHLGQNEIILVVEDEDLVRSAAVGALRDLGYVCLHASDAAEALKILESGAHIDLLFTDVIMPGDIKARDLAARAQVLIPGLPVLFTSGYTENAIVHHGRLDEGVSLISKPYNRDSLARRIRTMLEGARPTVLVVEDEPLVRMAAVDMIRDLGLAVIEAADAEQALGILESAARIDILFTDVGLPLMRGPELAARAKAMRPGIKVVFASGYGEGGRGAPAGAENLSKPYDQGDLARVLRVAS